MAEYLFQLLEENNISNIIVDTASRRDLMHMRLTNNNAFIRYVGANHQSVYDRLNDWVVRIITCKEQDVGELVFLYIKILKSTHHYYLYTLIRVANKLKGTSLIAHIMGKDPSILF